MTNNGCEQAIGSLLKVALIGFVVLLFLSLFGDYWWIPLIIAGVLLIAILVYNEITNIKEEKRNLILQEEKEKQNQIDLENQKKYLVIQQKRKEKLLINQQKYKVYIDTIYFSTKQNPVVFTILNNFLCEIPESIFLYIESYAYFESLISSQNPIGEKLLWSINIGVDNIPSRENQQEIENFYSGTFSKLKRLLQTVVELKNHYDYSFYILRFIQESASALQWTQLKNITGIEFENVENLPLIECIFAYYNKYQRYGNIYLDPLITAFTHLLIYKQKFGVPKTIDDNNFLRKRERVLRNLESKKDDFDFRIFEAKMKKTINNSEKKYSILDVDLMSGIEFENFIAQLFNRMGYHTEVTKLTGDYGVDVIAEQDGNKIAIQAKCYTSSVSNKAIQEITAGMKHYNCQIGVVVTNRFFTKPAIELAHSNGIQLWDRKVLQEKIEELF